MTPEQFLVWLSSLPKQRKSSLECGAGFAEIATFLSGQFEQSHALDINPIPLLKPTSVIVQQGNASDLPFDNRELDLVVSLQALHHFDISKHLKEARRVLRPGGVLACLCWGELILPDKVQKAYEPVLRAISPYWELDRDLVLSGYAGLIFEGREISKPQAWMTRNTNIDGLEKIMARWTSVQGALRAGIEFPEPDFAGVELNDEDIFEVRWPLKGRVFQI